MKKWVLFLLKDITGEISYLDIDAVPSKTEDAIVKGGINALPSNSTTYCICL